MDSLKVNDRVVCVRATGTLVKGAEYIVIKAKDNSSYIDVMDEKTKEVHKGLLFNRYELVPDSPAKSTRPTREDLTYGFKAPWELADIQAIHNELSYAQPMAIVRDTDGNGVIVVHDSVFVKALMIKARSLSEKDFQFHHDTLSNINKVKTWIKKIKSSSFSDADRPVGITVEVLEV
ncbi:MAG: hypothetical protein KAS32_02410 [Candidatus Peribacteraceae bacterium]|nr:hypothetical protein [Candidatus Peribacteraceae bacterium]